MITQTRSELAEVLTAAIPTAAVHRVIPEDLTGFDIVLQPGDEYVKPSDDTYDPAEFTLTCQIHILVSGETNQATHDALDAALTTALPTVLSAGWSVSRVTGIQVWETSEWTSYGIAVSASTIIYLGGG